MDSVIGVPTTRDYDPNKPSIDEAVARVAEELETESLTPQQKLAALANTTGNLAEAISATDLVKIGIDVVDDYEQDKKDRHDWEKVANEALDAAAQEFEGREKTYPWPKASNIKYPILSSAMLQFNARSYPAVVKGDEAVLCKVIGRDNGKPNPVGLALEAYQASGGNPEALQALAQLDPGLAQKVQAVPIEQLPPVSEGMKWEVLPGAKTKRAQRVSEYMNTTLFYRMEDWEADTDALLMQLPVVGCAFRKVWFDTQTGTQKAMMVSALRVIAPEGARSCESAVRLTEEIPDVYPSQLSADIRSKRYLDVDLYTKPTEGSAKPDNEDQDKPRLLLEQHRLLDLDDDGCPEPYICTVDHETRKVLRIEANYGPGDIKLNAAREVVSITKGKFFIKYEFFPSPKGKFYGMGLGHLLKQVGDVIDTSFNQMMDAGTAQVAGGGFMCSGVRLQSRGQGSVVRTAPGKWTTVDVPGGVLRDAMVPFTLPEVSPVTFKILDMILGAAKELASSKDVMTGEASNTGQVGTTLALIEQGLQVFNAIYKRVFRALKEEFTLLRDNIAKYGGEAAAKDYMNTLDDPEADFVKDFNSTDMDIRPVSDPSSVTRMQRMAKGQFIMGTMEQLAMVGGDAREALRRVYEAADLEDIDKLLPPPPPPDPKQAQMQEAAFGAEMEGKQAQAARDMASAGKAAAETEGQQLENSITAFQAGASLAAVAPA